MALRNSGNMVACQLYTFRDISDLYICSSSIDMYKYKITSYSVTLAILRMAKLIALQVFVVSVRMRQLSVAESVFF